LLRKLKAGVNVKIRAIIFGATGMVGEGVLHQAIKSPDVEEILLINRRPAGCGNKKVKEIIIDDFYHFSEKDEYLKGYNACYFCLGVSSLAVGKDEYVKITYDLTLSAAKALSALNPDMTFCYVSGSGTDSTEKGKIRWARVKGKTENDLLALPFRQVYMFRPGYIRPISGLEKAYRASKMISPLYPFFKKLFPNYVCTLAELGNAMISVTLHGYAKKHLENKDISLIGR
jgi:uncharacterized protein YbjT (DUF2867 family)